MDDVRDFLFSLQERDMALGEKLLALLKSVGYNLRMPYSKNILPGIFELRGKGDTAIRLIYTFSDGYAIVFHGFMKKTQQISNHEMNIIRTKYSSLHI